MKGIASSRQIIQGRQRLTDHSVGRLIMNDPGAPCLPQLMFKLKQEEAAKGAVQYRRAAVSFRRGDVLIHKGEYFFLVESEKYAGWYYVMIERNGQWQHSAGRATRKYIAKVEMYEREHALVAA